MFVYFMRTFASAAVVRSDEIITFNVVTEEIVGYRFHAD